MKKWIAIVLACALIFMIGCKKDKDQETAVTPTPEPTPQTQQTPVTPTPAPTPSPSQEPDEGVYIYTSDLYGFTVTMPASWSQCCIIEEKDMSVSFYSAANRYMEYDGELYDCGHLFTIMIPEDDLKEGDGYVFPAYEIIGQYNNADILVVYPSDVQIADFEDEDAVEEFGRMNEELPAVIDSITFG